MLPTQEDLRNNFTYFIKAVIPEAERAGGKLITHPSDSADDATKCIEEVIAMKKISVNASEEENLYDISTKNHNDHHMCVWNSDNTLLPFLVFSEKRQTPVGTAAALATRYGMTIRALGQEKIKDMAKPLLRKNDR